MYWYHPHPHGRTAPQTYGGVYGVVMVEDDDERALRKALDVTPGTTEIPLVLQDRRAGTGYAPTPADLIHGYLGDELYVNGVRCPFLDVATRLYRFRILNACNARTLSLAVRTAAGTPIPFSLIGSDGGLLPARSMHAGVPCHGGTYRCAGRPAPRRSRRNRVLHTLAFDAMHAEARCPRRSICRGERNARVQRKRPRSRGELARRAPRRCSVARAKRCDLRPSNSGQPVSHRSHRHGKRASGRSPGLCQGPVANQRPRFEMGVTPIEVARGTVEPGCCATTTRACRTRTSARVHSRYRRAKPVRTPSPRSPSMRRDACPPISDARIRCWYGPASPCASPSIYHRFWTADLHVSLPQPRTRGRRDDAWRGGARTRPLRPRRVRAYVPVAPPESAIPEGND